MRHPGLNLLWASLLLSALLFGPTAVAGPGPALTIEPHSFTAGDGTTVEAEMGRLAVPRHHGAPDPGSLTLHFVRFPALTAEPGPPIVYLAGGPGGSGIQAAKGPRFRLFMALREVADVIVLDQRGTGLSAVDPACTPPMAPIRDDAGGLVLTRETLLAQLEAAVDHCRDRWSERGVDLSIYTTEQSVGDLETLRQALDAERLDLLGISYGTHLALAVAHQMEERIGRMVLASSEGLDQTLKLPARTDEFLQRVEALFRTQRPDAPIPPLPDLMRQVYQRLAEEPAVVNFKPEGRDEPVSVTLGAFPVQIYTSFLLIKNPDRLRFLPASYAQMAQGDYERVATTLFQLMHSDALAWSPMTIGMDLSSGASAERLALVREQAGSAVLGDALNYPLPHILGGFEDIPDLGDSFRLPGSSDVPALLLTGTLDGRTYPAGHAEVLDGLTRGQQIVIENAGHDLLMADPAVTAAIVDYFARRPVTQERIELAAPEFAF